MPPPLSVLDYLSDDEPQQIVPAVDELSDDGAEPAPAPGEHVQLPPRKRKYLEQDQVTEHFRRLRLVVQSNCKCSSPTCRSPWKSDQAALQDLLQKRLQIHQLPKLEADREVLGLRIDFLRILKPVFARICFLVVGYKTFHPDFL